MELPPSEELERLVQAALDEDIGSGDATTLATIPEDLVATADIVAREPLVLAGLPLAQTAFTILSSSLDIQPRLKDGQTASIHDPLLTLAGPARAILSGERVALNFIQRLSGIATLTARFVQAIQGTRARILDTRKTTPGWRRLEKYAVHCGGGANHRFGLFDQVLIKDNHLAALSQTGPNPIAAAVQRSRANYPNLKVEVEADDLDQVELALAAGADIILLDNMSPAQLRAAVELIGERAQTEASGGIHLANIRAIAETGVHFISIGALTHSARSVDIALDFRL